MLSTLVVCLDAVRRTLRWAGSCAAIALALAGIAATAGEADDSSSLEPKASQTASNHATGNWFGLRDTLVRHGVTVDVGLGTDHSTNLSGGLQRGSVVRVPVRAALVVDLEMLAGWRGGRLYAAAQSYQGSNGSEALVGDAQGFDNVDASNFRQVSELWFEQSLWADRVRLKIGKADANSDFAHIEHGGDFLNSSAGFSPTILGFPSYPNPAAGVSLWVRPLGWLHVGAGVLDGATHEECHGRTGNRGPGTFWGAPNALFLIGETGLRWKLHGRLGGRVAAGVWRHTGSFQRFDGGTDDAANGTYAVVEQAVWRESPRATDDLQGIAVFGQFGQANAQVSEIARHTAAGATWTGAVRGRDLDALGLMVSSVRFTNAHGSSCARSRETAFELFYRLHASPWFSVKPDLQYISNPGSATATHALAATLRLEVAF